MLLRRLQRLLILLLLCFGLSSAGAESQNAQFLRSRALASTPALSLKSPTSVSLPFQPIDVQVIVTGAIDIAAFEFDLAYDRSLVALVGITPQTALGGTTNCNRNTTRCAVALGPLAQSSSTSLGAYSYGQGPGFTGTGALAIIHLQPLGRAGVVPLHLSNVLLADVAGNPVIPAITDGTVVIPHRLLLPVIQKAAR